MTPVQIPSFVEKELLEAITYYDNQRDGLGDDFASEVKRTLNRIAIFPEASPRVTPHVRLGLVRRFPYGLLYHVLSGSVLILALLHQKEGPDSRRRKVRRAG
jgi:hypothetical protein